MKEIIKIQYINLGKLNNAEYVNFSSRFISLVPNLELESLGLENGDYMRYMDLLSAMGDLVAYSRASDETAEMQEVDKERDSIGVHLLNMVRTECSSPIAARAQAAQSLYKVLKPYTGFQKLANQQETVTINGMLQDLHKEENASNMQLLGLTPLTDALSEANSRYQELTDQRTASRGTSKVENSKVLRAEMDVLYDYMATMIFVQNVAAPTELTGSIVNTLNVIIDEVNTSYNQRTAQAKAAEERKKKEEESEKEETPAE